MGLFLAMSCVVGGDPPGVAATLQSFVSERKNGVFKADGHNLPDDEQARLIESNGGVTLFYPDGFFYWDEASARLSRDLKKSVFSFHIHDGDLWMFILFVDGREVVKFNPLPDYWEELPAEERVKWLPKAGDVVSHVPGLDAERIAPYLREWPDDESLVGHKATPDDQFEFGQDWQVVDFMRQLGFEFPEPGQGAGYRCKMPDR